MSGDSSKRDNLPLILAIVAVVGVTAIGAYLLGRDSGKDGKSPPVATPTTIVRERGKKAPRRGQPSVPANGVARVNDWPRGRSPYTVVLRSARSRAEAEAAATRAAGIAGEPGVLHSSDYRSLRPGYWVAFAGMYDAESSAQ